VKDIKPNERGIDLTVKVVEVSPVKEVTSKKDGRTHRLEEVLVGDETGSVILTLWNDDVGKLEEGDVIRIENAYTTVIRGSIRLNVGRYGKIERVDEEVEANTENNISEREVSKPKRFRFPEGKRFD